MSLSVSSKRPVHACLRCRNRKIKCGREKPECRQCQQHGHRCTYEPDPPHDDDISQTTRAALIGNEQRVSMLQQRVDDLEATVRYLVSKVDGSSAPSNADATESPEAVTAPGFLREDDGEYRYVGSLAWEHVLPKGETNGIPNGTAYHNRRAEPFSSIFFAPLNPTFSSNAYLPPLTLLKSLWEVFQDRVDAMIRILHKPTFEARLYQYHHEQQASPSTDSGLPSETTPRNSSQHAFSSLVFAFLYIATRSLSEAELDALQQVSMSQNSLLMRNVERKRFTKQELMSNFIHAAQQNLVASEFFTKPRHDSLCAVCFMIVSNPLPLPPSNHHKH